MARIAVIFLVAVALAATVVIATTPQRDTVAYAVKRDGTGRWRLEALSHAQQPNWEDDLSNVGLARYYSELTQTGWDRLEVSTSFRKRDEDQAYAAGYAEGRLSAQAIANWHVNFVTIFGGKSPSPGLLNYVVEQIEWTRVHSERVYRQSSSSKKAKEQVDDAAFWRQVHLIYMQLSGLMDGYNEALPTKTLSLIDFYLLNAAGDLEDLVGWFAPHNLREVRHERQARLLGLANPSSSSSLSDRWDLPLTGLDCSAFVKPVTALGGGFADLLSAHTTWTDYNSMNRVFKQVNIRFHDPAVKSAYVAFSSRPGFLSSKDDFYVTGAGLISQETTNSVFNKTLYTQYISPKTVLTWMRTMIANRLADNGNDWTAYFAKYNSGTYNNQWMVTDTKLFQPGQPIAPNTLWILEQIPGFTKSGDVTPVMLSQGYWRSFNVPYFKYIYDLAGYKGPCIEDGKCPEYVAAPRYSIFGAQQASVKDISTLKSLMQYNNYQHDPLSVGDPANAISSRYDLRAPDQHPAPFGGIDSKLSSWTLLQSNMTSWAISGPTHQSLPAFTWANPAYSGTTHVGQPTVWDFDWQPMYSPWMPRK